MNGSRSHTELRGNGGRERCPVTDHFRTAHGGDRRWHSDANRCAGEGPGNIILDPHSGINNGGVANGTSHLRRAPHKDTTSWPAGGTGGGDALRRRCSWCGCGARGTGVLLVLQQGIAPVARAARVQQGDRAGGEAARVQQGNRAGGESGPGAAGQSRRWRERPRCSRGMDHRPRASCPPRLLGSYGRSPPRANIRPSGGCCGQCRPPGGPPRSGGMIRRDDLGGRRIRGKTFGR
jgi:hypothetical protein